jgi:hypothetical protein
MLIGPFDGSNAVTSWPRDLSARTIRIPEASDTFRSADSPPIKTVIFKLPSYLLIM